MPTPDRDHHDRYVERYRSTREARIVGVGREVTGRRKDGKTFPMELAVSEFAAGDRLMFTGIVRDITQRKRLEEQLLQSAKLAALGELVGGIAHEVNNPTGIIVMRSANLMREAEDQGLPEEIVDDIEVIQRQSNKIAQITSGLLAFSRQAPFSPQPSDMNRTVINAAALVENVLRSKGISYRPELSSDLPLVLADTTRIEQVLLNLFNNAMDAMPEGGELCVSTGTMRDDAGDRWVRIAVQDSGTGISEEDLGRVFDPFFTTKEVGKGTGLGLSISYGIIQEHGGRLEVESARGEGAQFQIVLPSGELD
jgi:signal transduction histidine kinase